VGNGLDDRVRGRRVRGVGFKGIGFLTEELMYIMELM
jgi:hypothetical protein